MEGGEHEGTARAQHPGHFRHSVLRAGPAMDRRPRVDTAQGVGLEGQARLGHASYSPLNHCLGPIVIVYPPSKEL